MIEYIEGTFLIVDDYIPHKGQMVETLIITRRVWEDPDSKTCLMPFVWTAKRVIVINENGKFVDIKKDNKMTKKGIIAKPKIKKVDYAPMHFDLATSDADWKNLGGQMKDYFKKDKI